MSTSQLEAKGFFGALFDFGFTSFITLRFLKVIYAVLVGLILLAALVLLLTFLVRGGAAGILFAVIVVPIVTLFYLVLARVYMEIIALFFRIGENTSVMAQRLSDSPGLPPLGGGDGWGPPPPTPGI